MLTPDEVAGMLQVAKTTLYSWSYFGTGPRVTKVGGRLRYFPADVTAWLNEQRHAP
jgi:predicted site-specific integrase-resolvase